MPITLKPLRLPERNTQSPSPPQPGTVAPPQSNFTFTALPPSANPLNSLAPTAGLNSPIAPDYSPITPKVQPILPTAPQNGGTTIIPPDLTDAPMPDMPASPFAPPADVSPQPHQSAIAPATFEPPPPPQPFSSRDSEDAIALRAAISALQFQKQKAKADLKVLDRTKRSALEHPVYFRDELAAGRLKEQRPEFGGVQAILDQEESRGEVDDEDGDDDASAEEMEADASAMSAQPPKQPPCPASDSIPKSQSADHASGRTPHRSSPGALSPLPDLAAIPGPQNIIRMPAINWEKYHIVGSALDALHEQQRRWPGSAFAYAGKEPDRGSRDRRDFVVAAPYSVFQDSMDGAERDRRDSARKDSAGTGSVSEHPMETRRGSERR